MSCRYSNRKSIAWSLSLAVLISFVSSLALAGRVAKTEVFDPELLQVQIFWEKVFLELDENEYVIHDSIIPSRIFARGHVSDTQSPREIRKAVDSVKGALRDLSIAIGNGRRLSASQQELLMTFRNRSHRSTQAPSEEIRAAAKRVRVQKGMREGFLASVGRSLQYQSDFERIFSEEGVPIEWTAIPFVESGFVTHARSKANAVGMWQFMPDTGRSFLRIDDAVDERLDPYRSARAAAQLLKKNYQSLESWPLAVAAYHHGVRGVLRVTRSEPPRAGPRAWENTLKAYVRHGKGFASRNYVLEVLAAHRAARKALIEGLFPRPVDRRQTYQVGVADFVSIIDLAKVLELSKETLLELNPALRQAVGTGERLVPRGSVLHLPSSFAAWWGEAATRFLERYSRLQSSQKKKRQPRLRQVVLR